MPVLDSFDRADSIPVITTAIANNTSYIYDALSTNQLMRMDINPPANLTTVKFYFLYTDASNHLYMTFVNTGIFDHPVLYKVVGGVQTLLGTGLPSGATGPGHPWYFQCDYETGTFQVLMFATNFQIDIGNNPAWPTGTKIGYDMSTGTISTPFALGVGPSSLGGSWTYHYANFVASSETQFGIESNKGIDIRTGARSRTSGFGVFAGDAFLTLDCGRVGGKVGTTYRSGHSTLPPPILARFDATSFAYFIVGPPPSEAIVWMETGGGQGVHSWSGAGGITWADGDVFSVSTRNLTADWIQVTGMQNGVVFDSFVAIDVHSDAMASTLVGYHSPGYAIVAGIDDATQFDQGTNIRYYDDFSWASDTGWTVGHLPIG